MNAGQLRHRVTIQQPTVTQNTHGESVVAWSSYAVRVAAEVEQLSGRALFNAQQVQPDISMTVRTRYLSGVTNAMRIVWHDGTTDRTLNIVGPPINPDGKRIELMINCMEPV